MATLKELAPLFMRRGGECDAALRSASGHGCAPVPQQYGKNLAIIGGLNKRALAAGKTATDNELALHLQPMLAQGGYIPAWITLRRRMSVWQTSVTILKRVREMAGS